MRKNILSLIFIFTIGTFFSSCSTMNALGGDCSASSCSKISCNKESKSCDSKESKSCSTKSCCSKKDSKES